jgi:hypothetical protein
MVNGRLATAHHNSAMRSPQDRRTTGQRTMPIDAVLSPLVAFQISRFKVFLDGIISMKETARYRS